MDCDNKPHIECKCVIEEVVTGDYILNVDATKDNSPSIAVTTANKSCKVYNLGNDQVTKIWEHNKYKSKVIDCRFSNIDRNILYTATSNGHINVLDLRISQKFVIDYKDTTVEENQHKTFNCFDVSSNDRLLAAGTDVFGGDAFILFWDTRNQNLLGGYWESHEDDITQVRFHRNDINKLISGSTDGLINMYDLSQQCEDDALTDTFNTESSVDELLWFNKDSKDYISCKTHTSDLQLWDVDNAESYMAFSGSKLQKTMMNNLKDFYLASCHETKNGLLIVSGSSHNQKEHLGASIIKDKKLKPCIEFSNNRQRVRASAFIENNNILVTGGEEGFLNVWKVPSSLR